MLKKFMSLLVILGLVMIMIILLPAAPALENINATPRNATAKNIGFNDTTLNSTIKNKVIRYFLPLTLS